MGGRKMIDKINLYDLIDIMRIAPSAEAKADNTSPSEAAHSILDPFDESKISLLHESDPQKPYTHEQVEYLRIVRAVEIMNRRRYGMTEERLRHGSLQDLGSDLKKWLDLCPRDIVIPDTKIVRLLEIIRSELLAEIVPSQGNVHTIIATDKTILEITPAKAKPDLVQSSKIRRSPSASSAFASDVTEAQIAATFELGDPKYNCVNLEGVEPAGA